MGAQRLLWGFDGFGRSRCPDLGKARPHRQKALGEASTPQQGKPGRAPETTLEEAKYLKYLIENAIPVLVKMADGEEVRGTIEYYDHSFIRITRDQQPNLFIFKHDIKYIQEL
ncbi:MAG TPA: RNA chaperone Hfq [Bryobacteraceae bacterium]|nr:RNA chaperone Hfq [Bryobacteraceae bacterium]